MRSCETCLYGKRLYVIARADEVMRCFRPRQMLMSGFEEAGRNGFDADDERAGKDIPGRVPGDVCANGRHWEGRP
mgnify:CR=1 FL=1